VDKELRSPARPYRLQPGDLILCASDKLVEVLGFALAGSWYPNHSMIVFAEPDGTLAALEVGQNGDLSKGVTSSNALSTLQQHAQHGRVWVRARKTPLTQQESSMLTEFAYKVLGRPTSFLKLYGQVTPFRAKMPLRAAIMGRSDPDKRSFFCCELVIEACCFANLIDAELARPNATYPRDVFFDRSTNYFVNRSLKQLPSGWEPPSRWTPEP
jgi:hypothetical protein